MNAALGIIHGSLLIATPHFLEHERNYFGVDQHLELTLNQQNLSQSMITRKHCRQEFDSVLLVVVTSKSKNHDDYQSFLDAVTVISIVKEIS
jgi:hypothetical protein